MFYSEVEAVKKVKPETMCIINLKSESPSLWNPDYFVRESKPGDDQSLTGANG
jgi:hypothetical protein